MFEIMPIAKRMFPTREGAFALYEMIEFFFFKASLGSAIGRIRGLANQLPEK
jgi:hypothetical protein